MKRDNKNLSGITDDLRSVFEASRASYDENHYLLPGLRCALQEQGSELQQLAERYWIVSLFTGVTASAVTACSLPLVISVLKTTSLSVSCDPLFMSMLGW